MLRMMHQGESQEYEQLEIIAMEQENSASGRPELRVSLIRWVTDDQKFIVAPICMVSNEVQVQPD